MSRRWSYGEMNGNHIRASSVSNVGRYDTSPSRSSYSSNYDSGLRSYSSNRALNDSNYGTSSLSRYGSSSLYESSRPPRPSSVTLDRYGSSGNLGSGIGSGSYRSSLEYSAPTRSYSYASGLSSSGTSYSSPYSSSNYRGTSSYSGYGGGGGGGGGYSSGRDYGSSRGLSRRDDYGSYGSNKQLYGSLSEAHSDITLRSTYTPKKYGTYDGNKEKNLYTGVLKSEREMEKSTTPEIEQAFSTSKPPDGYNRKPSATLQLPDTTTTNDEFNALYDRYVTHSPILALEKEDSASTSSSRRESDSLLGDSAYSSKIGQESENVSCSDKNEEEEDLEQDEETEQEESDTICCAVSSEDKNDDSDEAKMANGLIQETLPEESLNHEEEEVEYSAESADESNDKENEVCAENETQPVDSKGSNENVLNYNPKSSPWDDFNTSFVNEEEEEGVDDNNIQNENKQEYESEQENKNSSQQDNEGDEVNLVVYNNSKNPWDDFNTSFADDEGDDVENKAPRNPWDDFASSFADEECEEEEDIVIKPRSLTRHKNESNLQQCREIAASNSSLWSDFDVPYVQNEEEEGAEEENEDVEQEDANKEASGQVLTTQQYKPPAWEQFCSFDAGTDYDEEQCNNKADANETGEILNNNKSNYLLKTEYKPPAWEQFCSFDGGTDNEEEEDDDGASNDWGQTNAKPVERKYSIQIEAETDSESEDASDRKSPGNKVKKSSATRLLTIPSRSTIADTSASDVESEFEFNPNYVSATFPFLPAEKKQEERGRLEAHLALPAPVFSIQLSYDSDFPDEESVASVSDYEDLSDESEEEEEEEVEDVEIEEEAEELDDKIPQEPDLYNDDKKEQMQLPQIMVTSSDASEMIASDYQDRFSQESPENAYDADISRPASVYESNDNIMFTSADNDTTLKLVLGNKVVEAEDPNTAATTIIVIKKSPKLDLNELSANRSITPDSDTIQSQHSDRSDGEFDRSVYHDARDMTSSMSKLAKRRYDEEQESEVFIGDNTDDEGDVSSHQSDLFIDAPTTADILESKVEPESASEIYECHPKQFDLATELPPEEDVTVVAKKFQQAYKEAKEIEKQKLLSATVATDTTPAEKTERLIVNQKKPDTTTALSRTVKGVSDKAKVQQVTPLAAPAKSEVIEKKPDEKQNKSVAADKKQNEKLVQQKAPEIKLVTKVAKQHVEKDISERPDPYQVTSKKPQETWAKKSVQLETKLEKAPVKMPQVQILDKPPQKVKEPEEIPTNKVQAPTSSMPKDKTVENKVPDKKGEEIQVAIFQKPENKEKPSPNSAVGTPSQASPNTDSSETKAKLRTTGIDKMSEKFEPKTKQNILDSKSKTDTTKKVDSTSKPESKYAKKIVQPEAPAGPSFEEQMEELRKKMKAGSSQFTQQMKDLSKGISDVATKTKLVTEQETHKTVLTDATQLHDQVSKKVDKWKTDAEAEKAKREQELAEIAEKQVQKAKAAAAIKLASPSQLSEKKTPSREELSKKSTEDLQDVKEAPKTQELDKTKIQTGLRGREPSKVTSPFIQKSQEEQQKSPLSSKTVQQELPSPSAGKQSTANKQTLESILSGKQSMKPLEPIQTMKLPEMKASSASPMQRVAKQKDENKASSLSPSTQQQKVPINKHIAVMQRLGPEGESDHESKGPTSITKPLGLKQDALNKTSQEKTPMPGVVAKVKEEAPKQTAEIMKSKVSKADIVEPGVASQAKVKGSLHQAEVAPTKVHGADEAQIIGTKVPNKQQSILQPGRLFAKAKMMKQSEIVKKHKQCHKCKHRRNRFIGKVHDIDDMLNNKENKIKAFDQFELFYQNCSHDKRSGDIKNARHVSNIAHKVYIWDVTDFDELYEDKDLRTVMSLFSPTSKVTFDFGKTIQQTKAPPGRKPGDGGSQSKVNESAIQVYRSYDNGQGDFGSYLDSELSLAEQPDELAVLKEGRRTSLVLRTQLSVRVHTIIALGQVMLYVDGMNGVIAHNETIQWLYSLLSSQFRLVVKTALKLLLVFVEYTESNSLLLLAAVYIVDKDRDSSPWSYLMYILNDKDNADLELLVYAMTLINKTLNGIPDQDTYYDVVDALEEQGMEEALKKMLKMNHRELTEQCHLYEGMMKHEDGDTDENTSPAMNIAKMRQTPRTRTGSGDRKSHRKQFGSGEEKKSVDSSNGLASPTSPYKSKPKFEHIVPKPDHPKTGREKVEEPSKELNNNVSKPGFMKNRNQDSHATPGLPTTKRLTMDLLYKKTASLDQEDEVVSPTKEESKTKCPPPKLPDLTNDEGDSCPNGTPLSPPPQQKQQNVGAVHSLAEKFGPYSSSQKTGQAEPQPQQADDDDEDSQANSFSAALRKARKGRENKLASQAPVDNRKESDIQWEKAMENLNRPLIINDLDFTELEDLDDSDPLRIQPLKMVNARPYGVGADESGTPGAPPPPPPLGMVPPPPPFGGAPPPPPASLSSPRPPSSPLPSRHEIDQAKDMRTVKLFWKEAQVQPPPSVMETKGVFWQKVKPVEIDTEKVVQLFETKATKEVVAKKKEDKRPEVRILDNKRSNVITIGLTKLPPPRAIKAAILKFDSSIMNKEGIEKILTAMMPTEEEKEKIMEAQALNPDVPLGSAEQFLMLLSEIPVLRERLKLWMFMLDYANLEKEVAEPLMDLKLAMEELDQSRTFQYVMGTLLAVGNVLNGAEIKGFQLDFLAKVPEVKDTVHKHSLVYHLCTIVQEKFDDSTDLYSELGAVVRCAKVDFDEVKSDLDRMEKDCKNSWDHLRVLAKHESSHNLKTKIGEFLSDCAQRIMTLKIIHRRVINRFRKFLLYMGIPSGAVKDTKINSICKTIAEFSLDYRTCCEKINQQKKRMLDKRERNKTRGKMITDNGKYTGTVVQNGSSSTRPGGKDEQRHEELSKVLQTNQDDDGANSWKNYPGARLRQRPRNISPNPSPNAATGGGTAADGQESPDDEILDGLVKAATVKSDIPREQRRKARQFNRKSLRRTRTLKLVQDQVGE